jgi:flagellar hook-basal body complex protein FliE
MADPLIGGIGSGSPGEMLPLPSSLTDRTKEGKSFGETLKESIREVNQLQQSAEEEARALAMGKTKDVAETLIAIEKANISFQLMMQVRNKLVEAYQEVMRTQM